MKQIVQHLRTGAVEIFDVATPSVAPGHLLVRTTTSLISAGTERMLVEFGRGGYLAKARQQPEKVRQVIDKIRTDGLGPTIESVRAKLDQPMPMGYSNVGRVVAVGEGVDGFHVGDRVVSNGPHAEVVMVPKNLAARVPESVEDEQAAFTVLGAIALQGIRLIRPELGETIAVFGLGLIGQLAVQILHAHGARVIGFDYDRGRVALARSYGVEAVDLSLGGDPVDAAMAYSDDHGVDGVLVTAATKSDELMHQAAEMCRKRGRIVLTGVTGLNLRRADFYEKELTFQVSCSYGPGRYDADYELAGHDYPRGFVRWTEQRNFEAVLELLRHGQLATDALVSLRVPLTDAKQAYDAVAAKQVIGVMLTYPEANDADAEERLIARSVCHQAPPEQSKEPAEQVVCGLIGAGGFAQQKILPGLVRAGARLKWVATSGGLSGSTAARRFGIENSTTDVASVFSDPEVDAVVIATRHNTHAPLVLQALQHGKAVFVEKPLCLTSEELEAIRGQVARERGQGSGFRVQERGEKGEGTRNVGAIPPAATGGLGSFQPSTLNPQPLTLMVGYNRRFAPLTETLRSRLAGRSRPLAMTFTCNAGAIPGDHWTQDPTVGGGRILGELCHFVDLLHFLADESPIVQVAALKHGLDGPNNLGDTLAVTLQFADGSLGQINYFANGPKSFPKERLEVFSEGRMFRIDNFKRLECFGGRGRGGNKRCWTQDKGHNEGFRRFVEAVRAGGPAPIPLESILHTAEATLAVVEACREGRVVELPTREAVAPHHARRAA